MKLIETLINLNDDDQTMVSITAASVDIRSDEGKISLTRRTFNAIAIAVQDVEKHESEYSEMGDTK